MGREWKEREQQHAGVVNILTRVVGGAAGISTCCHDNDKEGAVGSDLGSDTLLSGCDTCF